MKKDGPVTRFLDHVHLSFFQTHMSRHVGLGSDPRYLSTEESCRYIDTTHCHPTGRLVQCVLDGYMKRYGDDESTHRAIACSLFIRTQFGVAKSASRDIF